ncbi:hypothetical protein [Flavobacterium capsici]|uniref:Uncharacterized protein n=1 Tax=Flavobacterium capsici TaxID=3075618 RepID=A0AA96EY44_9FLAO|nr:MULTISPECIES: hypothetical protein [unclassified Flavobacterium]WNM19275.1 hypothetical protein RN608_01000 [Flavobacterium sp. PMR2A8]WNM20664.1 hypothetical protein RN605_08170 [Flavobacterium sp. PMTSA4]
MFFVPGDMVNELVTNSINNFSMKGKCNPTFQNQGTQNVYVNGMLLEPGDSFPVNVPGVVLQNEIKITFGNDSTKQNILYIGYVTLNQ